MGAPSCKHSPLSHRVAAQRERDDDWVNTAMENTAIYLILQSGNAPKMAEGEWH